MIGVILIKHLLAGIFAIYVSLAGYNVVTSVPEEMVYIIQTADGRGNGSGVLVAPGVILTARHVAEAVAYVPLFVKHDGVLRKVKVKAMDTNADLALLEVDGMADLDLKVASISSSLPSNGTEVKAVGFPMNRTFQGQITTEGKVVGIVEDRLMATASILPGNSGGGLFARNWYFKYEVVGITVSAPIIPLGFTAVPAFHIGNSVPSNYIWLFLHSYGF